MTLVTGEADPGDVASVCSQGACDSLELTSDPNPLGEAIWL